MVQFLVTSDIVSAIEGVIRDAQQQAVLVSPYLQLSPTFAQRFLEADRRGVALTLLYGKKDKLEEPTRSALSKLQRLKLRFLENVHAKCYFNESEMVITSMNLYAFSANNREMGVLVTADEDIYHSARREVLTMLEHARDDMPTMLGEARAVSPPPAAAPAAARPPARKPAPTPRAERAPARAPLRMAGSCIRCGDGVAFNPAVPLCSGCYRAWAQWRDPDYEERRCHGCGKAKRTSMARPLCKPCYADA